MPIVSMPDGAQVSFPDDMPAEQIRSLIAEKFPQAVNDVNPVADIAKSAGVGLAKGGIGVAGLLGDARSLLSSGVSAATDAMGLPQDKVQQFKDTMFEASKRLPYANAFTAPGSQEIQKRVEGVTGEFYKPQTTAGEYAQTAAEFLPNLAVGPGGIGRKLLTNVAAPALASETAGQLTKGTEIEPYARVVGGVGGGALAAGGLANQAQKAARSTIPTTDDLLKTGSRQFESVRTSGATVDSNDVQIIAQGIRNKIAQEGADPEAQKLVFNIIDRLEAKGAAGKPVPYAEIDVLRKSMNDLKLNPDGSIRKHAKSAVTELMDMMTQVLPQNVSGTLKDAIGNWAAGKRSNIIQGKTDLGDLNAATAGAGGNIDNTTRQAFKQLARPLPNDVVPVAKKLGFNDAEIAQINDVARGTVGGNTARLLGKAAPTGAVSTGIAGGAGFALGGPAGAVAVPAVGYLAKLIGDMSTKRAVQTLDSLVRSRSPLARQVAASLPQIAAQLPPKTAALLGGLTPLPAMPMQVNQPAY